MPKNGLAYLGSYYVNEPYVCLCSRALQSDKPKFSTGSESASVVRRWRHRGPWLQSSAPLYLPVIVRAQPDASLVSGVLSIVSGAYSILLAMDVYISGRVSHGHMSRWLENHQGLRFFTWKLIHIHHLHMNTELSLRHPLMRSIAQNHSSFCSTVIK